jgi:NADH:ubiquinone oxidoreductase subunit 6 (subunit J)
VSWATDSAPGEPSAAGDDAAFGNAHRIGVGFLDANGYVVAFELAAVVLTVALVAAVYIARRKRSDLERSPSVGGRA